MENKDSENEEEKKEDFTEENVREILDLEFDTLEEWYDTELEGLREDYRKTFSNFNVPIPSNDPMK